MKSNLFEVFKAMSVIVIKDEIKTLVFVNLYVLSLQRVRELLEEKFLLSCFSPTVYYMRPVNTRFFPRPARDTAL